MRPRTYKTAYARRASGLALLLVACALAACGKQAFRPGVNAQKQASPGDFEIPAKVDVLLAQDDTGSMVQIYGQLRDQMPGFLTTLENSGWDYRFGVTPLTTARAFDQIAASRFDGNWNALGQWKPPFPGANPSDNMLPSWLFRTPDAFSRFLSDGEVYSSYGPMRDPGLSTLVSQIQSGSSWIRPDAYLVVLVVTNGEDGSGVNFCTRPSDGLVIPCSPAAGGHGNSATCKLHPSGQLVSCASADNRESTFQQWKSALAARKNGNRELIRFNSMTSPYQGSGCHGQYAYAGERYQRMSGEFQGSVGGKVSVDICSGNVSTLLSQTTQQLQSTRLSMRQRYLVLEREPRVETIRVVKHSGGQSYEVPQSSTDGWTYAGLGSAYLIDYPVPMNYVTNKYLIELHGSARLVGSEDATVEYERL